MVFSDQNLARRLERAESRSNASFVEARAKLHPESGAQWLEVAGTYAMFDGPDSPITQTFGLGLFEAVGEAELVKLEQFFAERGAPVYHEVSPMADSALLALLPIRGYVPFEYTSVLYLPLEQAALATSPALNPRVHTRVVPPAQADLWAQTLAQGWSTEMDNAEAFMRDFGRINAHSAGYSAYLAELDGTPIAAGGMFVHDGVALLAGASTVPHGRRQGGQQALLHARLRDAAAQGCTLALMGALPGSQSQSNAEKQGFRIAYTRIKWQLQPRA
ncbi:GNAT family N-acetyltransferase [Solirubrum puertoriconensis]|uniref:N-acetyltransferase domain-containing protein n=1 Tax=Solirubrum puertoriconensis TaxID=1751427 RepID=A0A9X0HMG8_SOLP1|nr:GNAT family N-acetyltransferase [Solirubrum puertoriconensis]KUG08576.1 hypothetical protein ASU33_10505 [Solirubrum puertoriconensis]